MRNVWRNEHGLTLVELLAAMAILGVLVALLSGLMSTAVSQKTSTESHITLRQEANVVVSNLRKWKNEPGSEICLDDMLTNPGVDFQFVSIKTGTDEINSASRCGNSSKDFDTLVSFTLENDKNQTFEMKTTLEKIEDNVTTIGVVVPKPDASTDPDPGDEGDEMSPFEKFIRENNVFVYSSTLNVNGSADIYGEIGTIVVKDFFTNKSNNKSFNVKNIYLYKGANLKNFQIGSSTTNNSQVYVNGDLDISSKNTKIYGSVFYTGKINGSIQNKVTGSVTKVNSIQVPEYSLPTVQNMAWYQQKGYQFTSSFSGSNKKIYAATNSTTSGNLNNVTLVSEGNMTIKHNITDGILFAPNGVVDFTGNTTFTGIIIAKSVEFTGNVTATFTELQETDELPF